MNTEYDQLSHSQLERLCDFIREDYGNDLSYEAFADHILLMLEDVPINLVKTVPVETVLVERGYWLYTRQANRGDPTSDY